MKSIVYFFHLIYLAALPTLGQLAQFEQYQQHMYPYGIAAGSMYVFTFFFIPLVISTVRQPKTASEALLQILVGPILSMILVLVTGGTIEHFFYTNYILLTGWFFVSVISFSFTRAKSEIQAGLRFDGGSIANYILGAFLLLVLFFGALVSVNVHFWLGYFENFWQRLLFLLTLGLTAYRGNFLNSLDRRIQDRFTVPAIAFGFVFVVLGRFLYLQYFT